MVRNHNNMLLTQSKYMRDLLNKTKMKGAKSCPSPMMASKLLSLKGSDVLANPEFYRSTLVLYNTFYNMTRYLFYSKQIKSICESTNINTLEKLQKIAEIFEWDNLSWFEDISFNKTMYSCLCRFELGK